MTRHIVARIALIALTALPISAFAAAPIHVAPSPQAGRVKMVHLTVKNASAAEGSLLVGDQVVTLKSNETAKVEAPVGTVIYAKGQAGSHADGSKLFQVTRDLDGATCSFN